MEHAESFYLDPDEFAREVRRMFPYVRSKVGTQRFYGPGAPTYSFSRVRLVSYDQPDRDAPATVPKDMKLSVLFEGVPGTWVAAIQAEPADGALRVVVMTKRNPPQATGL